MKIEIKKLTLTNFKGIRSLAIDFNHITNIFGENATGKTTLMDAFLWLLFGKDSSDRKDFEIKTLDENNQPYHRLDHEVEATLNVDGTEIILRRCYREKWTKPRGTATEVFSGHETAYFWNDVPMKQDEYQQKIAALLNENIFKLITNTTYFNNLKWQERRAVLISIAGEINDAEILKALCKGGAAPIFEDLIFALNKKTVEEYKRELSAKKKKIKDELEPIPSRIDEANRSLPEEKDYSVIDEEITTVKSGIENIDGLLMNKSKAAKDHQELVTAKIKEAGELRNQNQQIEFEEKNKVQQLGRDRQKTIIDKKSELRNKQDEKNRLLTEYNNDTARIEKLTADKAALTAKWESVNKEELVFDEKEFHCPACKRAYETSDIESKKAELIANFNTSKSNRLAEIKKQGSDLADQVNTLTAKTENTKAKGISLKTEIEKLEADIAILEEQHSRLAADEEEQIKNSIATNTIWIANNEKIGLLNEEINTPYKGEDNSALLQRKKEMQDQLSELTSQLSSKSQREKQLVRIAELQNQEAAMAQELAGLEGIEFSIEQFIKAKMDELESRINGRFKIVRFKMFEEQINGGQVEACTTLINGVPYSDANTAAKIQAGLDIINTLSAHYDVQAPVWVDNRESVISLPETECQLINLIVSEKDRKLRISSSVKEMELA